MKEKKNKSTEEDVPASGELSSELEEVLKDIPQENRERILQFFLGVSIERSTSFSGPLPPPALLQEYSEIVKDGAERIFQMTEQQSAHRKQLEDHAIREELMQSRRGQGFGFILGTLGLVLATILALMGKETIAGIFGTTTIVALVTVFVIGKKTQSKED